ncbi:hypothetical protein [Candidatus Odyssella acanthamoebae]|uniref:Uncharacterized protein n=1 Tax=Candidatus Odyssella acanthamoebae TaxID=91604 RepID=A0A077AWM4_9PROT|nr:hypothetical protein [Candidatus Paracaedibacter acanthamoebae]AIK96409.1 hypothetical protein ID47_06155 [Candidatus Paracaedibacter acanthamoebae]
MTVIHQKIDKRSYWQGYEAPSTAFLTTDVARLKLGQVTEAENLEEPNHLPDIVDLLVEIQPEPTTHNPSLALNNRTASVFKGPLADYRFAKMSLEYQGLARLDGVIKKRPLSIIFLSGIEFETLMSNVNVINAPDKQPLGGFWQLGCELERIKQYSVTFFEADNAMQYRLHPEHTFIDYIRDRHVSLQISGENSDDPPVVYKSIEAQRHGSKCAWITFEKQQ